MNELRGRSGRGQGCGDLLPDMAAFSHAGHDDAALAVLHKLNRALEFLGQSGEKRSLQRSQSVDPAFQRPPGDPGRLQLTL
jgi:hypothetical protein